MKARKKPILYATSRSFEDEPEVEVAPKVEVAAPAPKSDVDVPKGAVVAGLLPNKPVPTKAKGRIISTTSKEQRRRRQRDIIVVVVVEATKASICHLGRRCHRHVIVVVVKTTSYLDCHGYTKKVSFPTLSPVDCVVLKEKAEVAVEAAGCAKRLVA